MINLYLIVNLIEDPIGFTVHSPNKPDGFTLYDLDNYSDGLVISTALRAISESQSIKLEIRAVDGVKLGAVLKIFNALIKYKGDLQVSFTGNHSQVEKMLRRLPISQS
ncbi:MAG: hypothetical protein AAF519_10445 [Bacteroidota bacterium]